MPIALTRPSTIRSRFYTLWAERRLPDTAEAELSADDFAKYFGSVNKVSANTDQLDLAAEVFERVRDRY